MNGPHECVKGDLFDAIKDDLSNLNDRIDEDTTSNWVKWALGIMFTVFLSINAILGAKINQVDADWKVAISESQADRRSIAEKQASIETRQIEQYNSIMAELKYMREKLDKQQE